MPKASLTAIGTKIAAIQSAQRAELQLKLFPDWPDDRRGAPNEVIRSAIFGVVQRGRRKRVIDRPAGSNITITGWRLDQYDLDIWLEVMHLADNEKPGETVTFSLRSMPKRLISIRSAEARAMPRSIVLLASLVAAVLCGCAPTVPRLHQPQRVDAYCGDRAAISTAIESIVASTSDAVETPVPPPAAIRQAVKDSGGVVAHWSAQPLYLPKTAKALGLDGDFVTLGDAAIGNGAAGDSRLIYLTLTTKAGPRTVALRAFDVQDVCNEGKLKS